MKTISSVALRAAASVANLAYWISNSTAPSAKPSALPASISLVLFTLMFNKNYKMTPLEYINNLKLGFIDTVIISSEKNYNMDLLYDKDLDLYNEKSDWKIYTGDTTSHPQLILEDAVINNSMVTQGCIIDGEITGSVLFDNVHVGKGAKVVDSVIMPGALIEEGAEVYKAIIDENVVVSAGTVINKEAKKVELVSNN